MELNSLIVDYPSPAKFININDFISSIDVNYFIIVDYKINKIYDLNIPGNKKFIIKSEERYKSINSVNSITNFLLSNNCGRDTVLVGIGGGIVTDLTGFIASIYKRGIKHILIPTTLLAMVDAAYGAKTAVNFSQIKNALGTIKIPQELLIDTNFLNSLANIEILNGMGEVIKISMTSNKELYNFLNKNDISHISENLPYIVQEAIKTKCIVIKDDLDDNNARRILNFGHSIGHIIELNHKIKHGIAISIGGVEELKIISNFLNSNNLIIEQYSDILRKYNIKVNSIKFDNSYIYQLLNDKKVSDGIIDLINIKNIGDSEVIKIDVKFIEEYYGIY